MLSAPFLIPPQAGCPLLIPSQAGERKGTVMPSVSEASEGLE